MRITGFHVDGFGLLHDQAVDDVPVGTTVVLGPNEAGKSTLHAFLVRTLFGHPRANDADGRNRHEPLRGGRHGGVVRCADDAGHWEVHRYTEGSPRLRVVAPDGGESTGNDAVLDLLGRTVDEHRYEQVFAIDLDDLAGVGSLGGGALDDLLFDAATVGTGRSLRAARDEAVERRDTLWTPTSTKRPLAAAIRRRADARTALTAAQDAARANLDVRRRLDEATARVEELAAKQQVQLSRVALLERVRDAWESWSRATQLQAQVDELPAVAVAPELVETARSAAQELTAADVRVAELQVERDRVAQELGEIELDTEALAVVGPVEALAEGLGAHELAVEQLAGAVQTREEAERSAQAALADLGDGWDAERAGTVAVDAPTRQRLEVAGDTLLDAQLRAEAAVERATEAARTAQRRQQAVDQHAAGIPDAPDEGQVAAAEQAVAVLRAGVPTLERIEAASGVPAAAATPPTSPGRAGVLLALAVLLAVTAAAGLLPAAVPGWAALVLVAVVVGVSAYLLGAALRASGATPIVAAEDGNGDLAAEVARAARSVGLSARPSLGEVEKVATRVSAARDRQRAAADAERHLATLRNEAEDADARAAELAGVAEQRERERDDAADAWERACDEAGLDPGEGVRVTLTRHDRVAAARRALDALAAARDAVESIRPRVEDYRTDATEVAAALGHDQTGQAAVRLLSGLRERVRAARATQDEHDQRTARLALLDRDLTDAVAARERAQAARDEALAAAEAETLDELEDRAAVATQRADLAEDLARAEQAVDQLLGSGPRGEEGRELLRAADPTAWEEQLAAARDAAATLTEERDRALAERTELESELRRLGGDDAVPRAAQELAAADAEVAGLAERWAVADTAARLLEETVARFEREQQPRVLTRASELFERATGGQWAQVRRLDGQVVVARSEGGDPVPAGVLSRGTREQLWLCLRLALAEDLSQDRPLPLLVDDLLGTSDPERSLHVARVLAEVARRQQVWLFTCHPRTADLVTSTDPTAGVLRLRRGGKIAGLSSRLAATDPDEEFVLQLDV